MSTLSTQMSKPEIQNELSISFAFLIPIINSSIDPEKPS